MKFFHLSDLHLGKTFFEYSLIDDQRHILKLIIDQIKYHRPDGMIIAGDIYDTRTPTEEAVELFDSFLSEAIELGCPVYIIAGNHDSAKRLAFCNRILCKQKLHIANKFSGRMEKLVLKDSFGNLNLFMLPFISPSKVRSALGLSKDDKTVKTPDDAFKLVLEKSDVNREERNILICHQFVIRRNAEGQDELPKSAGSEGSIPVVGGLDCISLSLLEPFDYVAMGHIHKPQHIGRESVRYCGSPLKYSQSELDESGKSITVVSVNNKSDVDIELIELVPKRDVIRIKGPFKELIAEAPKTKRDDYIIATLTDQLDSYIPAIRKALKDVYPHLAHVMIEEKAERGNDSGSSLSIEEIENMDIDILFEKFYIKQMKGKELNQRQKEILQDAVSFVEEEMQ